MYKFKYYLGDSRHETTNTSWRWVNLKQFKYQVWFKINIQSFAYLSKFICNIKIHCSISWSTHSAVWIPSQYTQIKPWGSIGKSYKGGLWPATLFQYTAFLSVIKQPLLLSRAIKEIASFQYPFFPPVSFLGWPIVLSSAFVAFIPPPWTFHGKPVN